MAKTVGSITSFSGISDGEKEGQKNACYFERSVNFRDDAQKLTILPKSEKDSANVITALPKWGERIGTDTYIYDEGGNIYKRTSGTYTHEHLVPASHGNGLCYFGEDRYLYYAADKTIGRWGTSDATTPNWYDDFMGSEGGAPTNTHSAVLEADSSQYFYRADTASASITGDISIEAYLKPESLPATGEEMTIVGKWDEDAKRSYKLGITASSNYFGDGSDGALTIATDTTEAPIDSACTGTSGTYTLSATNTSFAAGQKILIHQTQGTNAGVYQITSIVSYTAGTITTQDALNVTYTTGAQVRKLPQYTDVTVSAVYTAKAWNGTTGGILAFFANGTVSVTGTAGSIITGATAGRSGRDGSPNATFNPVGGGFRGGGNDDANTGAPDGEGPSHQGESDIGVGAFSIANNGAGGGGVHSSVSGGGGGGAGHSSTGSNGELKGGSTGGQGGTTTGSSDLTTMQLGAGGAGGSGAGGNDSGGYGGNGGGIIFIAGATIIFDTTSAVGALSAGGAGAGAGTGHSGSGGGSGSGGSILLKTQTGTLGTLKCFATGQQGGVPGPTGAWGGTSSAGRITLYYSSGYTGTTNPTLNAILDSTLSNTDGYALKFSVSTDGSASETYTKEITDIIPLDTWARWAVTWDSSASECKFYKNGTLIHTQTGALTAIHDNASQLFVGADKDSEGTVQHYYDGKIDDVRIWNDVRTATELVRYNDFILYGNEPNLIAYYKFDNNANDSQTSALNSLTGSGTPTYDATDPAFTGLTSRTDLDQSLDTSGNTYTLPTAIDEGATARQTFVPAKDPQESIQVNVAAKGTGNWTLTVHDALNRLIASKTVATADMTTGDFEFIFSSVWRPVIGASYHFHITSTVADGTVVTTDNADLETADFHTYYQFLVEDTAFHPIAQMLNFLCIGNERYLATWDAATYTPHKLVLPSGYKIRCFGYWREYIAIGTWRGSTITSYDTGRIFFWDGTSATYNFFIDVPEGGINALFGTKGLLTVWAGYLGDMLLYAGGDSAQKIKRIPKVEKDEYVEIFPGAVDMWRSLLHFGVAGNSDSTNLEKGVYSYGSLNRNYPESLGYDYPLSTEIRTGDNVKVGMVKALGQSLLVGWQSGVAYGVDEIHQSHSPFSTATYETLITDMASISREKYPLTVRIDFNALASGESIVAKYKRDRETYWKEQTEDTAGATNVRFTIHSQVKEIQLACDLKTTTTTSPTVTGLSLETEKGERERLA